jgi:hypothetical protein
MTCNTNESIINVTQSADTAPQGFQYSLQTARGSWNEQRQNSFCVTGICAKKT